MVSCTDPDRSLCMAFMKQLLKEGSSITDDSNSKHSLFHRISDTQINSHDKVHDSDDRQLPKNSIEHTKTNKMTTSREKTSTIISSRSTSHEYEDSVANIQYTRYLLCDDEPLTSSQITDQSTYTNIASNGSANMVTTTMEPYDIDGNDYLLRRINQLSLKLNEKMRIIKDQEAEIRRLKITSLGKSSLEICSKY
jgi:hypothetical protein